MKKPLPHLKNWEKTRDALHQSLQPLRSASVLGRDPVPNGIEYSTYPTQYGATTGPLSYGGELQLDFTKPAVIYEKDGKEVFKVSLEGENQTSLFNKVFEQLESSGLELDPDREKVTETANFEIDKEKAKEIADLNYRVSLAIEDFRKKCSGNNTPVVLWPHGFDLSFIHFFKGEDEKKDPHMNFGFVMAGVEKPYFYFYAWPVPDGLIGKNGILPSGGSWVEQWSTPGGRFEYDSFSNADDPEELIVKYLSDIFAGVSQMMKK